MEVNKIQKRKLNILSQNEPDLSQYRTTVEQAKDLKDKNTGIDVTPDMLRDFGPSQYPPYNPVVNPEDPKDEPGKAYEESMTQENQDQQAANAALADLGTSVVDMIVTFSGSEQAPEGSVAAGETQGLVKLIYNYFGDLVKEKRNQFDVSKKEKAELEPYTDPREFYMKRHTPDFGTGAAGAGAAAGQVVGRGMQGGDQKIGPAHQSTGNPFTKQNLHDTIFSTPGALEKAITEWLKDWHQRGGGADNFSLKDPIKYSPLVPYTKQQERQVEEVLKNMPLAFREHYRHFVNGVKSPSQMGEPGTVDYNNWLYPQYAYRSNPWERYLVAGGRVQGLPEDWNIAGSQIARTALGDYWRPANSMAAVRRQYDKMYNLETPHFNPIGFRCLMWMFNYWKEKYLNEYGGTKITASNLPSDVPSIDQADRYYNSILCQAQRELGFTLASLLKTAVVRMAPLIYRRMAQIAFRQGLPIGFGLGIGAGYASGRLPSPAPELMVAPPPTTP